MSFPSSQKVMCCLVARVLAGWKQVESLCDRGSTKYKENYGMEWSALGSFKKDLMELVLPFQ
jgi:hypothetical protein